MPVHEYLQERKKSLHAFFAGLRLSIKGPTSVPSMQWMSSAICEYLGAAYYKLYCKMHVL